MAADLAVGIDPGDHVAVGVIGIGSLQCQAIGVDGLAGAAAEVVVGVAGNGAVRVGHAQLLAAAVPAVVRRQRQAIGVDHLFAQLAERIVAVASGDDGAGGVDRLHGAAEAVVVLLAQVSFQSGDGNLVIYNASGNPLWAAKTQGDPASKNGFLRLQNDGNLVLCTADGSRAIWSSRTGPNTSTVNIQPLATIQGDAQSEYFEYNNGGQLWRSNSGDGVSKVMLYDLQGNLTMEIRSASEDLKTRADASAVLAMTGTRQTRNVYDALGRQVRQVLANGANVYQSRDRWGNVLAVTDARDASWKTEYLYDANNQVIRETKPTASLFNGTGYSDLRPVTQYFYDYAGRQVAVRDARGSVNQTVYDSAGNVISEIRADGGVVSHAYNAFGNETGQTDAMASQGIMLLSRQQQDFSWTDVAVGAAVGLVGGGLGQVSAAANFAKATGNTLSLGQKIMTASLSGAKSVKGAALLFAKVATYAAAGAAQNALGQGIKIAIDGGKFDWKSVAISAASGATTSIGDELAGAMGEKMKGVGDKFSEIAAKASRKVGPALQFMSRTAANAALGAARAMASNAVEQGYEKAIDPEQYSEFDFTRLAFAAVEGASGNLGDTFADEKKEDFKKFRQEIPEMLRIGFNKSKLVVSDIMLSTRNNISDLRTAAGVQLVKGKTTTEAALKVTKERAYGAADYVVNRATESVSWLERNGSVAIDAARKTATSAGNYVADGASTVGSALLVIGRTATNAAIGMTTRAGSGAASGNSSAASAGAFKVIAVKSRAAPSPAWVLSQTPPSP